ncbi:f-box domain protein [Anaeramoeba ignava]|uniref:F-box domain protein n=1 Tax=Anaeramoeba ignava TaxID=1746090 RepID=A0A9Q0LHF3_ANAIG|nr:f-box domain protein [Anaeramoeba ignava]
MEMFQIQKYGDDIKATITNNNFHFLKIGEMSEVPENLRKPPEEENLIIEMLPEEVHLYIFQFLSPGSLSRLSMTCKIYEDLSQDINCWRNISFKYWRYFLLKDLEIPIYNNNYYYNVNYEENIPIYGIIEEPEFDDNLENSELDSILLQNLKNLFKDKLHFLY